MYSYTHDAQTGGLLLNLTPTESSKEPRPVYAEELNILGFDKYWEYDRQTSLPYMWAESNLYYYRGVLVAKLKGGNIYTAPEIIIPTDKDGNTVMPEPEGIPLRPIDIEAMVEANREILELIEQTTVKRIFAIYKKYKNKLDCFHVAFSGGKDSQVLLDLVKKALPKGSFVVVFGDTGMEFPDTYDVVEIIKKQCEEEEILFYTAKSHLEAKESWELFGPPSRTLRWCCSVHKSSPQILKLREITGKNDYKGLAFVGIRAFESVTRAEYDYFNEGKKTKGQFSHNSMLEWTSAEVWLYLYSNSITLNEAYKKGNSRAGCISCPLRDGKSRFFEYKNYQDDTDVFLEIIKKFSDGRSLDIKDYLMCDGWNARKNGRDLSGNNNCYEEVIDDDFLIIKLENSTSNWKEWIKTIDIPIEEFSVQETNTGLIAKLKVEKLKQNSLRSKFFRQAFRKAAYCQACSTCETNCTKNAIKFNNGKVEIEDCISCGECHDIDSGCLRFHSLRHPQGGGNPMKSLNTMSDHAPKTEWIDSFFKKKNTFFNNNDLGSVQFPFFRRFLRDSEIIDKNQITAFGELIAALGWKTNTSLGLILINLVFKNPQVEWYVLKLNIGTVYTREVVEEMLIESGVNSKDRKGGKNKVLNTICTAFRRLVETPLGTVLNFGHVNDNGSFVRTKCYISDPRIVLYGLFKFAEKCNDYKKFTLATLLNDNIERDGVSPTRIFGLDREDMKPMLLGLTAKYSDFINASFTHDMDKITLAEDKTSQDVLDLFKEGL